MDHGRIPNLAVDVKVSVAHVAPIVREGPSRSARVKLA